MNTQTQTDEASAEVGDAAARQVTPGPPLQPGVATGAGRWGNDAAAAREAAEAATGAEAATAAEAAIGSAADAGGVGVIARTDAGNLPAWHTKEGKFAKGNPGGRRQPKDKALVAAVTEAFPPETVVAMLHSAYEKAEQFNSWRGQLEIAKLIMAYAVGTPVRRSISVRTRLDSILSRLESVDTSSEIAGMVIDSVAEEPDSEG